MINQLTLDLLTILEHIAREQDPTLAQKRFEVLARYGYSYDVITYDEYSTNVVPIHPEDTIK